MKIKEFLLKPAFKLPSGFDTKAYDKFRLSPDIQIKSITNSFRKDGAWQSVIVYEDALDKPPTESNHQSVINEQVQKNNSKIIFEDEKDIGQEDLIEFVAISRSNSLITSLSQEEINRLELIKQWRLAIKTKFKLKSIMLILTPSQAKILAKVWPKTTEELENIQTITDSWRSKYGDSFLLLTNHGPKSIDGTIEDTDYQARYHFLAVTWRDQYASEVESDRRKLPYNNHLSTLATQNPKSLTEFLDLCHKGIIKGFGPTRKEHFIAAFKALQEFNKKEL